MIELTELEKQILAMRDGKALRLTYKEIAKMVGLSETTVRRRAYEAAQKQEQNLRDWQSEISRFPSPLTIKGRNQ